MLYQLCILSSIVPVNDLLIDVICCCVCCSSDFMSVPFQAIECYMSSVIPLHGKPQHDTQERVVYSLLSVPLLYHSMGQIIKSVFFVCVCMYVCMYRWPRLRSHFSTDLHETW